MPKGKGVFIMSVFNKLFAAITNVVATTMVIVTKGNHAKATMADGRNVIFTATDVGVVILYQRSAGSHEFVKVDVIDGFGGFIDAKVSVNGKGEFVLNEHFSFGSMVHTIFLRS